MEKQKDRIKLFKQTQSSIADKNKLKNWAPIPDMEKKLTSLKTDHERAEKVANLAKDSLEKVEADRASVVEESTDRSEIKIIQEKKKNVRQEILELESFIARQNESRGATKKQFTALERQIADLNIDIKG